MFESGALTVRDFIEFLRGAPHSQLEAVAQALYQELPITAKELARLITKADKWKIK